MKQHPESYKFQWSDNLCEIYSAYQAYYIKHSDVLWLHYSVKIGYESPRDFHLNKSL